jgi:hypothetical protein
MQAIDFAANHFPNLGIRWCFAHTVQLKFFSQNVGNDTVVSLNLGVIRRLML